MDSEPRRTGSTPKSIRCLAVMLRVFQQAGPYLRRMAELVLLPRSRHALVLQKASQNQRLSTCSLCRNETSNLDSPLMDTTSNSIWAAGRCGRPFAARGRDGGYGDGVAAAGVPAIARARSTRNRGARVPTGAVAVTVPLGSATSTTPANR